MALIYNGTTIPYSGTINYNGTALQKLVYNSTIVWNKQYTLTITLGTGVASATVTRTSTENPDASTGTVAAEGAIYYLDALSVTATASAGYTLNSYTTSYTVTGNVLVPVSAYLTAYSLSVTYVTGVSTITVNRNTSPLKGAATGTITTSTSIYYSDTLTATATASAGYSVSPSTKNYTVTGNTHVEFAATKLYLSAPSVSLDYLGLAMKASIYNGNNVSVSATYSGSIRTITSDGASYITEVSGTGSLTSGGTLNLTKIAESGVRITSENLSVYFGATGYDNSSTTTVSASVLTPPTIASKGSNYLIVYNPNSMSVTCYYGTSSGSTSYSTTIGATTTAALSGLSSNTTYYLFFTASGYLKSTTTSTTTALPQLTAPTVSASLLGGVYTVTNPNSVTATAHITVRARDSTGVSSTGSTTYDISAGGSHRFMNVVSTTGLVSPITYTSETYLSASGYSNSPTTDA